MAQWHCSCYCGSPTDREDRDWSNPATRRLPGPTYDDSDTPSERRIAIRRARYDLTEHNDLMLDIREERKRRKAEIKREKRKEKKRLRHEGAREKARPGDGCDGSNNSKRRRRSIHVRYSYAQSSATCYFMT